MLIILGLLVATAVSAWVTSGNVKYTGSLDPQNPRTSGAKALAQVLGDQGVDIEIVRSADSLEAASVSGDTILVTSSEQLGESTAQRLIEHAGSADLVVVQPGPDLVELLGYDGLPVTGPARRRGRGPVRRPQTVGPGHRGRVRGQLPARRCGLFP